MPDLSRRLFTGWVAASPLLLGASGRSRAAQNNIETPPVFASLAPSPIQPVAPRARLFAPDEVRLLDGPFLRAQNASLGYMKRLEIDRLLHVFRVNAGIASSAKPLGGWEAPNSELRGHFVGHYLSACALGVAATGDADLRRRAEKIVEVFAECQQRLGDDGYLSAFPRSYFDRLAAGQQVWAPFYTLHKVMAGLVDVHEHAASPQGLSVAIAMARWVDKWTAARDEAAMQKVLEVEFGGMNEVLYRLAAITGDAHWIAVGDRFTRKAVFEPLAQQKDTLRGFHANTHIPQVIGAERRFELTGDARFRNVADFFWQTVTQTRSYATGGSSNNEYWLTEPNQLAVEWENGRDHQECCCSYNMLRLGSSLFARDPNVAIVDYYERNLINHRLSTMDLGTGRTGYFLSLTPGAWKVTGTEETTFWCCNGSALEDFFTLSRMIYAHDTDGIWVNLFMPSRVEWKEGGVRMRQETDFPRQSHTRLLIEATGEKPWTLRLRMPAWLGGRATVNINGTAVEASAAPGSYLELTRTWRSGDRIGIELPMQMHWEVFPDRPIVGALVLGPVVLAQQLPLGSIPAQLMHEHHPKFDETSLAQPPAVLPRNLPQRIQRADDPSLLFFANIGSRRVEFRPLYESNERYVVYSQLG